MPYPKYLKDFKNGRGCVVSARQSVLVLFAPLVGYEKVRKPKMPTLVHIHSYIKYKKNQFNNPNLYKCNHPHCTHYAEKALIIGKASICSGCGREFILDFDNLRRIVPKCLACMNTKAGEKHRAVRSLIDSVINTEEPEV